MTTPTKLTKIVYTPAELVPILRVGKNRVGELLRCGAIRAIRTGRRYLIPRDAVLEFLNGGK